MSFHGPAHGSSRLADPAEWKRLARHWVAYVGARRLLGGCVSALVVGIGGWVLVRPSATPVESRIPHVADVGVGPAVITSVAPVAPPMKVHVAGAVRKPGVYSMAPGSRVVDAVRAAGGPTDRADLERINLAQVVIDTEQVYVPVRRANAPRVTVAPRLRPVRNAVPVTTVVPAGQAGATLPQSPSGSTRIDLNSATMTQLDSLPGVGPATARAIVTYRTRKGPFVKVEDLMNVPGIGPARFAALKDLVSV